MTRWVLIVMGLAFASGVASGALFAVDLGTEYLKISIVKPGRIPIQVVINEMSKRKTPAMVGFVGGERLIGEEAASLTGRYPDRVYTGLKDWLGRTADDAAVQRVLREKYLPYEVVPGVNSSSLAVRTGSGAAYSAEELVVGGGGEGGRGSLLHYARQLAEVAADGAPTTDCVLTVPSYFTPAQRGALLDAAKLAGLNVLGLIHNHAAAALQYGIERDFANRTERVLFYDMGSGTTEAALVKFSSYTDKKGATFSQFEVLDVAWVESLGGDNLEVVLMEYFADLFNQQKLKGGRDVRSSPKAMARLRNQVKRTKQILSANSEAPISVEELFEDHDFRATITRDKFEELAGDFWERATLPLTTLMARNNLTAADLGAVELLGGGSRVPRLKAALSDALGGRSLDMHLDGDEAIVLGAGLFAANLSTTFRLRKFGMADKVPYTVTLKMEGGEEGDAQERVLVPAMKKMPTKRVFSKGNVTEDSLAFSLSFDNEQGAVDPGSVHRAQLGRYQVSGISSVVAKYGESGKVSIHTRVDQGGVFHLEGAESVVEVVEKIPEIPPPTKPANATSNGTQASNSSTAEGEGNSDAPDSEQTEGKDGGSPAGQATNAAEAAGAAGKAVKTRKRVVKVPLNITATIERPTMTDGQLEASRQVLMELRARDLTKRETAKTKNDLEAYIISTRDTLESDKSLAKVTTDEQREALLSQLNDMEDWLYGDGDTASAKEYREQLSKLRKQSDPMFKRAAEQVHRPKAVQRALDFVERARKAANAWPDLKPWLPTAEVQALLHKVEEFASWLGGKVKEQEGKAPHEDPAFASEDVHGWLERVKKAFNKLNSKKKPKPPPPPPTPANDTSTNTTDSSARSGSKAESEEATDEDGPAAQEAPTEEGPREAEETEEPLLHEELR
ncbi:hypothetical protein N2152v2_009123 [Parachlorella kessleri]